MDSSQLIEELAGHDFLPADMDAVFYHYTSAGGLKGILDSQSLQLTKREYMNDIFEEEYARRVIKEACESYGSGDLQYREYYKTFMGKHFEYIFSLTDAKDAINFWSYYGKNDGYCIGFKIRELIEYFRKFTLSTFSGPVIYEKDKQIGIIHTIFSMMEHPEKSELYTKIGANQLDLELWISIFYSLFKQQNHSSEREYRIIVQELDKADFKVRNGAFIPYIEIKKEGNNLPINSITIGPRVEAEIAKSGLAMYLKMKKLDNIPIDSSEIKIR